MTRTLAPLARIEALVVAGSLRFQVMVPFCQSFERARRGTTAFFSEPGERVELDNRPIQVRLQEALARGACTSRASTIAGDPAASYGLA